MEDAKASTDSLWSSLTSDINAWVETQETFRLLDDNMQSLVTSIVSGLDLSQLDFTSFSQLKRFFKYKYTRAI